MKGFVNVIIAVTVLLAVAVGAWIIIDKLSNKNRLEDDYLDCDISDELLD